MPASRSRAPRCVRVQREHPPQVIDGALHQPVLHEHVGLRQHAPDVAEPRRQPRPASPPIPVNPDRPDSPETPASGPELSRGIVATGRTPLADTDDGVGGGTDDDRGLIGADRGDPPARRQLARLTVGGIERQRGAHGRVAIAAAARDVVQLRQLAPH